MEIDIKPNDLIHGSYRVEHPIGYGAYGMVWKGYHEYMKIPVAIKIIDTRGLDPNNLERVKQECLIGGKLAKKANIVEIQNAFPEGDYFYIVMELMTGGSLESYLHKHPHPDFNLTLTWALDLCQALGVTHAANIIHRDLKPLNILLTADAQVKLSDFGVSHLRGSRLTTAYQPGTYGYQAPEQEANQTVDAGVDVFALAAVLFEIWTGKKYLQYRTLPPPLLREEMALLVAENYPNLPLRLQKRLMDALQAGLRPRQERITLAGLQEALQAIQKDWQQMHLAEQTVTQARAQVAEQIKPPVPDTVISYLPQRPVATPSRLPGDTALTRWLENQFGRWYTSTNNLVLWFDPAREWELLLDHLSPNLNLIRFQGSQLEVRYQVEQRSPDRQTVVYLPLKPDEVDYLLPYRFTSRIFDKPVYDFLLEQGSPLPQTTQERRQIKEMLPQLIQESIGKGEGFWQGIIDVEKAQQVLIEDFTGRLGQFLNQPVETLNSLDQTKLAGHFQKMIETRFGYIATGKDPASFAQGLVTHLCLVELFYQSGGLEDFPLKQLLPNPTRFNDCRSTLNAWRNDSRYLQRFVEYARTIEKEYVRLVEWSKGHTDRFTDPPLPSIAQAAWEQTAQELAACTGFPEVAAYLQANQARIQKASQNFWSRMGETPGWQALNLASQMIQSIQQILHQLNQLKSLNDFIQAYTGQWWQIDRLYRQVKALLEISFPGDQTLVTWSDRFYIDYLTRTNQRWSNLLESQKSWGLPGLLSSQISFWSKASSSKAARRAILLVDGLRYELGASLEEQLREVYQVELEAMVTGLPSVTPLGMSALLPEAGQRQIDWQGSWEITLPNFKGNLADKAERDKWWRSQLNDVEIISLRELLRPETTVAENVRWLIITAGDIDAIGENTGALTPNMIEDLLGQINRGIRQILKLGFAEIHVVTDHGFLLLDRVTDHGKAELPDHAWLKKSSRYALGRDLPATEHLSFPIPHSQALTGWFPHGVTCFKSLGKYNYVHGASLQEVIIPYLVIRPNILGIPVEVNIGADDETRLALFKVTLTPVRRGLLSQEREIRLVLERSDGRVFRESVEVIGVEGAIVKNFRIAPADNISYGDTIHVTVYDARTQERLDQHPIRVLVSLDL